MSPDLPNESVILLCATSVAGLFPLIRRGCGRPCGRPRWRRSCATATGTASPRPAAASQNTSSTETTQGTECWMRLYDLGCMGHFSFGAKRKREGNHWLWLGQANRSSSAWKFVTDSSYSTACNIIRGGDTEPFIGFWKILSLSNLGIVFVWREVSFYTGVNQPISCFCWITIDLECPWSSNVIWNRWHCKISALWRAEFGWTVMGNVDITARIRYSSQFCEPSGRLPHRATAPQRHQLRHSDSRRPQLLVSIHSV